MSLNNYPPLYALLVFIGIALLLASCEGQITEPDPKLLPIPEHGATPLPNMAAGDTTLLVRTGQPGSQQVPPAYDMLTEYAEAHPENPYVAVVGVLDEDQDKYNYKTIPLSFPDDILEKAAGERAYYWYRLKTGDSQIVRNLATLVPAAPGIKTVMDRWLKLQINAADSQTNEMAAMVSNSDTAGTDIDRALSDTDYCRDFRGNLTFCEAMVVTDERIDNPDPFLDIGPSGWPQESCFTNPACDDATNPGGGGGSGGSSPGDGDENDDSEEEADAFEERIDDSELDPCMQDELETLKNIEEGVGEIVQKFANSSEDLGYNWKVKDGTLPQSVNGQTSSDYDEETGTVTTTFDANKFGPATDLAVARTFLHEAVHAYIISVSGAEPSKINKTFSELMLDISKSKYNNQNDAQHAEFVRNFVSDITSAMMEFGISQGYNLSEQYYMDLAWGGLTDWPKRDANGNIIKDGNGNPVYEETPWFKKKYSDASDRNRIKNNIATEQGLKNTNDQKGNNSGC